MTLRVANDYAAVIEGQRAGNIHIAYYGPASFARARIIGVKTDAFAIDVNSDGSRAIIRCSTCSPRSPYQKIEDLKGKAYGLRRSRTRPRATTCRASCSIGWASIPTSSSRKTVFAGSHENAVLALAQGTVDVAANWWNAPTTSI